MMGFIDKFKNLLIKNTKVDEDLLSGIDIDVENMYVDKEVAIKLEKRYGQIKSEKEDKIKVYKQVVSDLAIVQKIEALPKEFKRELEKHAAIYSKSLVHKSDVQKKIKELSNTAPTYLEKHQGDIPKAIKIIKEYEEKQRLVTNDLNHLEGEKIELNYQSIRLNKAFKFLKNTMIFMLFAFSIAVLILTTLFFVYDHNILTMAIITMTSAIFFGIWTYVFRRYLIHELKKNQLLQKRAIELINKTKIKYVNNQQLLDYEYKKYKVNSSEMLELRWDNYKDNINNKKQYKSISNNMITTLQEIEKLLRKNSIDNDNYVIEKIDYFSSKKGRVSLAQSLEEEKNNISEEIKRLGLESDTIEKMLENINNNKTY